MSLFEGYDASFLLVEVNGFFHPGFESGQNLFHRVDHGGNLDV